MKQPAIAVLVIAIGWFGQTIPATNVSQPVESQKPVDANKAATAEVVVRGTLEPNPAGPGRGGWPTYTLTVSQVFKTPKDVKIEVGQKLTVKTIKNFVGPVTLYLVFDKEQKLYRLQDPSGQRGVSHVKVSDGNAQPIDPERQIVFKVQGLKCPLVRGIGCGHMLGPVLQRLDQIDGVEASSANHTGTLLHISVKPDANREQVANAVKADLTTDKRNPSRLAADELRKALSSEVWRGVHEIGQLSAIEFRKLNLDYVKAFAEAEKLRVEVSDKLIKLAEREWDRLAKEASAKEADLLPHQINWRNRSQQFADAVAERSTEWLSPDQRQRLINRCSSWIPSSSR
jgi:hypothetical protein